MRSSSALLLLTALAAGSGFCQSYITFEDFLDSMPSCSRSCTTERYKAFVNDCGGQGADLDCVCTAYAETATRARADGKPAAECVAQKCDADGAIRYTSGIFEFISFCTKKFT